MARRHPNLKPADWTGIERIKDFVHKAAAVDHPVLLLGEPGVGKTFLAKHIHTLGPRAAEPFRQINCSTIIRGTAVSQLFGHKRGIFTGASHDTTGIFGAAADGTVFLDEIHCLEMDVQQMLLHVLDDGVYTRLGEHQTRYSNARVIVASNKNLDELAADGRFAEDLLGRFDVLRIQLPPLRDRSLAAREHAVLNGVSRIFGSPVPVDADAMESLANQHFERNYWTLGTHLKSIHTYAPNTDRITLKLLREVARWNGELNHVGAPMGPPAIDQHDVFADTAQQLAGFASLRPLDRQAALALAAVLHDRFLAAVTTGATEAEHELFNQLTIPSGWIGEDILVYALATVVRIYWAERYPVDELTRTNLVRRFGSTLDTNRYYRPRLRDLILGRRSDPDELTVSDEL